MSYSDMLMKNGIAGTYRSSLAHWWSKDGVETPAHVILGRMTMKRKAIIKIAEAELGVTEKTGNNDGVKVEEYLASVGLKKGNPYCAAFISWVFKKAGYLAPRTGWSPALFPVSKSVKSIVPGHVFGIYFPSLKRIAHCGFIANVRGDWVGSVEGNTNITGSREGDGVHSRLRHKRSLASIADWLKGVRK